jgi:hypothetical protein
MGLLEDIKPLITPITSSLYLGDRPDTPDTLIVLYLTGGKNPIFNFDAKAYNQPTFQVYVRSTTFSAGQTLCESIKTALDGKTNYTVNTHRYISIFMQGDIFQLGKDARNRSEFTMNFACKVK